jgi:hypothetical protein
VQLLAALWEGVLGGVVTFQPRYIGLCARGVGSWEELRGKGCCQAAGLWVAATTAAAGLLPDRGEGYSWRERCDRRMLSMLLGR